MANLNLKAKWITDVIKSKPISGITDWNNCGRICVVYSKSPPGFKPLVVYR